MALAQQFVLWVLFLRKTSNTHYNDKRPASQPASFFVSIHTELTVKLPGVIACVIYNRLIEKRKGTPVGAEMPLSLAHIR